MKKNTFNKKNVLRVLQAAAIICGSIQATNAAPVSSPEFTVNGTTVTGSGTNTTSAYFTSTSLSSAYQVTINKGAVLGTTGTGTTATSLILLGTGSVVNNGSLSNTSTNAPGSVITIGNGGSVVNNGSITSTSDSTGLGSITSGGAAAVVIGNTGGGNGNADSFSNTGTLTASAPTGGIAIGLAVIHEDTTGNLQDSISNSGTFQVNAASATGSGYGIGALAIQAGGSNANLSFTNSGTFTTSVSGYKGTLGLAAGVVLVQIPSGSASMYFTNSGTLSTTVSETNSFGLAGSAVLVQLDESATGGSGGNLTMNVNNSGTISANGFSSQSDAAAAGVLAIQADISTTSSSSGATANLTIGNSGVISAASSGTGEISAGLGVIALQADVAGGAQTLKLTNSGSIISTGVLNEGGTTGGVAVALGLTAVQFSTGSSSATLSNSGTISAVATNNQRIGIGAIAAGVAYIGFGNLGSLSTLTTNPGSLTSDLSALGGFGGGSVAFTNTGNITAVATGSSYKGVSIAAGILAIAPTINITNSGTISGYAQSSGATSLDGILNAGGYGILLISPGVATISSTGTIAGSTEGIFNPTGVTVINLDGGNLTGKGSYAAEIETGTVSIKARSQLVTGQNYALVSDGPTGTLNLRLVGGTPEEILAAEGAAKSTTGKFIFGGYTYSWKNFSTNLEQAISLEQVRAPQFGDLARKIDYNALPLGFDPFYNEALDNPNAALNELSGFTIIEGMKDLELNSQNTFLSTVETQLESLQGEGGFSTANLTIGNSTIPGINSANSQLDRLTAYADTTQRINANTSNSVDTKDVKTMTPVESVNKWTVWAAGDITIAHEDGQNTAPGYNAVNGTPLVGVDYAFTPDIKAGFLSGATLDGANFGDGSKIDATTELVGIYAALNHGPWFLNGLIAGGPSQYENGRPTFAGTAHSDPSGYSFVTQSTIGYTFPITSNFSATPEAGLQYTHLGVDSYSETGAGIFDTSVASNDTDSFRTHLGGKLDGSFDICHDLKFIPELRAAWYHEYLDDSQGVSTSLAGAPVLGSFNLGTVTAPRDYALVGVGLNTVFTGYPNVPVGMFVNYDVQAGQSNYIQHNITGGIKFSF